MAKNQPAATEEVSMEQALAEDGEGVQVKANREKYTSTRSASGAKSLHSGDAVAVALDGCSLDDLYPTAADFMGVEEQTLREKYSHLNIGMQRMNLGNRIRGHMAKIDKANETAEKKGPSGEDRFKKAAAPMVKATEKRRKDEADAKAKAEKEKADKAAADAKAKEKKAA